MIPTEGLDFTVRYGYKTPLSFSDKLDDALALKIIDMWLRALLFFLENPAEQAKIRAQMVADTMKVFNYRSVAERWIREFKNNLEAWTGAYVR